MELDCVHSLTEELETVYQLQEIKREPLESFLARQNVKKFTSYLIHEEDLVLFFSPLFKSADLCNSYFYLIFHRDLFSIL